MQIVPWTTSIHTKFKEYTRAAKAERTSENQSVCWSGRVRKDVAEDGEAWQENHKQRVAHCLDSIAFDTSREAPIAEQRKDGDDEALNEELASWEPQSVQFENEEDWGDYD